MGFCIGDHTLFGKAKMIMLVGLPGAGKSLYAEELKEEKVIERPKMKKLNYNNHYYSYYYPYNNYSNFPRKKRK